MTYLSLPLLKRHLLIDDDFTTDDNYIIMLGNTAEALVSRFVDCDLSDIVSVNDGHLPEPIIHAMMLLVGTWYANRESVTFGSPSEIPHGVDALLGCYKNYNTSAI